MSWCSLCKVFLTVLTVFARITRYDTWGSGRFLGEAWHQYASCQRADLPFLALVVLCPLSDQCSAIAIAGKRLTTYNMQTYKTPAARLKVDFHPLRRQASSYIRVSWVRNITRQMCLRENLQAYDPITMMIKMSLVMRKLIRWVFILLSRIGSWLFRSNTKPCHGSWSQSSW